ncbi:MAG: hypothetical protein WC763_05290 [Candidatus Paceibacterota bacterium]
MANRYVCFVCGKKSLSVHCSPFCGEVFADWMRGLFGNIPLRKAYTKARADAEVADTLIQEMVAQETSS